MEIMGSSFKKIVAVILLHFFTSYSTFARQIPTVTGILKTSATFTSNVITGSGSAINIISVPVVAGTLDYNVRNTISLKYDLNTDTFFLTPANIRVKVTIARLNAAGGTMPTISRKLNISINNKLNKAILEQSSVNLANGYQITMTVDSIWVNGISKRTLPRYVSVESEINLDRYYDFSSTGNTVPNNLALSATDRDCDGTSDELELTWSTPAAVPEEYQVEWYYVSNYIDSTTYYPASLFVTDFKNNSTRITTTSNSYKVSLIYPNGYIVFRVRAVGRNYSNPSEIIYGNWNVADKVNIGGLSSAYYYTISAHEKRKNWQYSITFAEEGKKKEVISYFDGSLHNRQTVTKVNSDKNVIVGETMYDYQGRPAINVLPVPVNFTCVTAGAEPVVKYYNKFNVDDTNKVYSKNDFDLDAGGACLPAAAPMDTISGASQYYSNNNPNKALQQGYLPHAKEFPFTQIEYTPDNTGRVRSQSGLGKNFKLGSGKETKFLYGQPNQLQLDRLFGSEVGDASHYKKNVVIDPNGQTSVTYLNQEGKTVATGLAGIPPTIGTSTVTRLDSLTYAAQNQTVLTVDLFNKNALGVSNVNTIPASKDQICFSSQLLVEFRSTYDFRYTLNVPTFPDACLRSGVCVSCIYDMEIQVKDECGVDLVSTVSPYKPIKRVTGNVDTTGNKLTFNTNCTVPLLKDSAKVSLVLQPGVYTINKILKVNQLAKDYYVKKYTDSVYNSCVMTLYQFQHAELNQVDTSDCYNTCASCLTALGTRDDYVSLGKGTAEQWDFLAAQCNEPCRQKTLCQESYEIMLADVSPGGQYGKFNQTTYDASSELLSVYNDTNALIPNRLTAHRANWRSPLMILNGNMYNMYLDENGVRTKVILTPATGGNYLPPVSNTSLVYLDNVANLKYTYPENLQNLSDFIAIWKPKYALSLVVFHPEYAYYVSCMDQSIKFPGDNRSSDDLDSLLFAQESFQNAVSAGFVLSNYLNPVASITKLKPIWSTATVLYDPFFTNSTFQYLTTSNPVTGSKTSTIMAGTNKYNVNLQAEMTAIVTNYNATGYSMPEVAAFMARCGGNFGTAAPASSCIAFGTDYYSFTTALNDSIRNKEWRIFRQLYFSEKQKLQFKRMNFYAKYGNDSNSDYYGGCNACIGNSNMNIFTSGMVTLNSSGAPNSLPESPIYDPSQPCGFGSYLNYEGITKRFYDPASTGLNPETAALFQNEASGQCPMAFLLQNFLSALTSSSTLTSAVSLSTVGEFNPDLYNAVNGGVTPPVFIPYLWQVTSSSGSIFSANIVDPNTSTVKCTITLDRTGTSIPSFASIIGINQLLYDATGTGTGPFKAVAIYVVGSNTLSANIKGSSSCMNLKNCTFLSECKPTQLATDLMNFFSYAKTTGQFFNSVGFPVNSSPTYDVLITPAIAGALGSISPIYYQYVSPDKLTIYYGFPAIEKLIFTYSVTSGPAGSIKSFSNIKSDPYNFYIMDGLDVNGQLVATIKGQLTKVTSSSTVVIPLGTCELPDPAECSLKEHKVRRDLEYLVNEILSKKPFSGTVNLYNNLSSFSPLLRSYQSPAVVSTTSTFTNNTSYSPNFDTLTIRFVTSPASAGCIFKLYHYRNNGTANNFGYISNVTNLEGIGSPDIAGNYYSFQAIAHYQIGTYAATDTIYGYSCWPIKNCKSCLTSPTGAPINTYTYSTAFNRATNTPYNGSNNGSFDPYWKVISTQPVDVHAAYSGSLTVFSTPPLAYDIGVVPGGVVVPGAGYINYSSTDSSLTRTSITYKTDFVMPNPLPTNTTFSLSVRAWADDAILRVSVNGVDYFKGIGGDTYGGVPATAFVYLQGWFQA